MSLMLELLITFIKLKDSDWSVVTNHFLKVLTLVSVTTDLLD